MSIENDLAQMCDAIEALESKFVDSRSLGLYLRTEDAAEFKRLVIEATSLLSSVLGSGNPFTTNIIHTVNSGSGGFVDGPSLAAVRDTRALLHGAINHLQRTAPLPAKPNAVTKSEYVARTRIAELEAITSTKFDLSRLIQLCSELNAAHANDSLMSVAMLVRAIVDHVPPIFERSSFAQVASNYGGSRSFKTSMVHLDNSLRSVADAHLHTQVRAKEALPTAPQVDFRADVDVLLSEIARLLK